MKKPFTILALSVVCLICAFGFTACEDNNAADTPIHKHSFVDFTVNPTCAAAGYTLHKCACGEDYKDNFTDALSHNYINGKCALCGASDPNYVEPVEECKHDYEWTTVKEPTETEEGVKSGVCKKCGDTITQTIPTLSHEHNYIITVKAPTCTTNGYTLHKCACGNEYTTDETLATGHNFGEWITTKQPTCTEKGEKTATCTRCPETKTEEINATGHNYVNGICEICGKENREFELWADSSEAADFNGDRRITEEDYNIYLDYKNWKVSVYAFDYDGDRKINYDDYLFATNPDNIDLETWLNSDDAYDYNADGFVDKYDFSTFINWSDLIIGEFKIINFNYQITPVGYSIYLINSRYQLQDLANDIEAFSFEISKDLKLSCVYDDTIKAKLGADEILVQNAINSCVFEKLSDILTTATFNIQDLYFTVYLTKTENGFSSSISCTIDGISAQISFDISYVK